MTTTTTCGHAAERIIEETGFCFACWHDSREATRSRRRAAIAAHLADGGVCREGLTSYFIHWDIESDGRVFARHEPRLHRDVPTPTRHEAFARPFTVAELAEHLESREHGFGFELTFSR